MLNEIRTSTITSKGQIVIPSEMREREGFKSSQKVAILAFDDRLEIRPLKHVLDRVDFEAEAKKSRAFLKDFVKKHNLKGIKIKELSAEEKDRLAEGLYKSRR